jgi:putative endonuclease
MTEKRFYVYMLTNFSNTTLYTGMTNDLCRRIWEHKEGEASDFTKKYKINRLVYYEVHYTAAEAIDREKVLKLWHRAWKNELVDKFNAPWKDLFPMLVPDN